ncbi:MAG: RNA polymerase subunit sigma-70 [Flavobacteriales bacterium CG_4_9_14_0_2_um_filter_35_242]|nr:sigma-70 family RNA polymerase sigma factor [Zetaproteobacteria bacterium]NDK18390.1 sigma-70 family RNA polymerase sigma factor [Flavobacteriales bacterium]OIO13402.1 MAG: RNA polymerase subunit sigma-70 [Flavobacteriaceae bacterium CG1_02_35_72]PIR12208.1 MAG: RNA polymerase subunit sigma-70 [Flavobacteriales bacterium CG11_big_fil_rev_8_21_14_0_20_35_7]PIV16682.1 MAG: RNA polymerase subunit sigma-70 [Flavobacteriales bacterium CG03_land_8_20_14_0_80_35_15]PIX05732.1 MAG: RNA polymerase s
MTDEFDQEPNVLDPNKWIDLYADYLFNYTISRIDDAEQAKDIVQETFLSALKAMKNYRGEASERTWLVSILKRKIIDQYRKMNSKKGKAEIRVSFYETGGKKGNWLEECVPQTWSNEAEIAFESKELGNALNNCLEALPDKYKAVFKMKTIDNVETEEICNELNITASNLWVIIHRARLQLRKCMEESWFKK